MARPKRDGDWVPVTARLDVEAAKRLRVAAATQGTTAGRILDELILSHLPSVTSGGRPMKPARPSGSPLTIDRLRTEMDHLQINQTDLGRAVGVTPRAVSEWFERGKVPPGRQAAVAKALAAFRTKKP